MHLIAIIYLVFLGAVLCEETKSLNNSTYDFELNINQDAFLTTDQLIKKYGYKCEIHTVQTPDGYILEMHRIPKPGAIPVYLQHGLMDSSAGWVIMGPHSSFAYYLSDLGYDVWLGNSRGNRYSRKHIYLSPERKPFWDFSFHELGTYDLPSTIDYIIAKTGYEKIHYIGHSQGTTSFWVMCSQRPGYCNKILSMHALAPIAFMKHLKSPLIKFIAPFVDQVEFLMKFFRQHEFLPNNDILTMAGQIICKEEAFTQIICNNIMFLIAGYDSEQFNKTMLPAILGHIPAGTSTKAIVHYGQLKNSAKFRLFDYGLIKNKLHYGTLKPPSYDLSKVTAPVSLYYSMNDWLADTRDVDKLHKLLPNVVKHYLVPKPKFNHLDFTLAIHMRTLVHNDVVKSMKNIEKIFLNHTSQFEFISDWNKV